jgi:chromosome partitioning protein
MHTTLPRMAAMYDVVIIDVGGTKETKVLGSAMLSCGKGVVRPEGGIVLIPCKPSQLDLWGLTDTLEVLDTARSFVDGGIEARILLNQLVHGTSVSGKAAEAIAGFEEVPMLHTRIHNRVAFANAIERGCGVNEIEPNGKAALEIEHLWNELCAIHETMKGAV